MKKLIFLIVPLATLLVDCATLDRLPEGTCGNGVVDANEDCDSFPVGSHTQACGAPSSGVAACRLLCGKQPDGDTFVCPDGWGCSVDGICRQPTGSFDPPAEPVSAGVDTMLVGDFDGDGRADVLGSSAAISKGRIHYFKDGAAPDVVPLPGVLAAPVVYDFDGDGLADIAFGYTFRSATEVSEGVLESSTEGGYAIIQGQTDRAVVTKLFPTLSVPQFDAFLVPLHTLAIDVPTTAASNPVIAVAKIIKSNVPLHGLYSVDSTDIAGLTGYKAPVPDNAGELAGSPIGTSMFDLAGDSSTCGEVVYPGTTEVLVYSPCERVAGKVQWSNTDPLVFTIPGETITRVFSADVDNDGHDDLIVGTTSTTDGPEVHVGWSDGHTLLFDDQTPDALIDVPLAAGLIDSDELTDFVIPAGVLFSTTATLSALKDAGSDVDSGIGVAPGPVLRKNLNWTLVPAPTKHWTSAQIADVNRDDAPDVIGASQYEPDLDVLQGSHTLNMPAFSVQTSGSVTNLAIGDFDFDGCNDVAFVIGTAGSSESEVDLAYGRALAMPPEAPRAAGRLDGIRQVFPGATGISLTSAAAVTGDMLPTFSFAVLLSSADRQPVAPLFFSDTVNTAPDTTRRELLTQTLSVAPNGDPTNPAANLIGIVSKQDYRRATGVALDKTPFYQLWAAPGTGLEAFNAPTQVFQLAGLEPVDDDTGQLLIQTLAADIDGDGKTELVTLAAASNGGATYSVYRSGIMQPASVAIAGKTVPDAVRAQLLDVDADGKLDLVAILHDAATSTNAVNVLFGDGKGNFATTPAVATLAVPSSGDPAEYAALDFTLLTTGGAPVSGGTKTTELVIVTAAHLFRVQTAADRTMKVVDATSLFGTIVGGTAVVAGDFDGDGVPDLAIAAQGSIRIASQQPRLR